jgi:riboflavin biosynthesis pyrimidine reductase
LVKNSDITNIPSGLYHQDFALDFEDPSFRGALGAALSKAGSKMKRPLSSVLVEGGPQVLSHFMKTESYDNAYVSISSSLTGGVKNRIFAHRDLRHAIHQKVHDIKLVGGDLMLHLERA